MLIRKICILGGTGFIGRSLANRLSDAGYKIRILTRNRDRNKQDLILLPNLELIEADIFDTNLLATHLKDCDAVINLVGILNEAGTNGKGFERVHFELTKNIVTICEQLGIRRLIQMSALNAAIDAPSHYLRTKGQAEDLAHMSKNIMVTSFRPSVVFGPGDSFFNRFATLLKMTPLLFPLACSNSRFAPLYVGDLTDAMLRTLEDSDYYGQRLEVCGPEIYTLRDLVEYTARCISVKRVIFPLPDFLSRTQAVFFDLGGIFFHAIKIQKPFSMDNYQSLQLDSITNNNALDRFDISLTGIDAIVPGYLTNVDYKSRFDHYRQSSRRSS